MADEAGKADPGDVARRLRVHGLVQGVYYRYAARQVASALGLSGWVGNRHDGSVEAFVQGPPERVEQLVAWCREGPRASPGSASGEGGRRRLTAAARAADE